MATLNATSRTGGMTSALLRVYQFDVSMDSSYPTGGETIAGITTALDGLTIRSATFASQIRSTVLRYFRIDPTTKKVMAYTDSGTTEVANATDLSAYVNLQLTVICE